MLCLRLIVLCALFLPVAAVAQDAPADPNSAQGTVGSHGGLVRLPGGIAVGLLPGSAREGAGWHLLRVDLVDPLLPPPEGVGPRAIDRRALGPLGLVEGPPVSVSKAVRITLSAPDPAAAVGTGMEEAAAWDSWLAGVPDRVMPWVDPSREGQRKGLLLAIPDAGPAGTDEEVDVWLRSPGGLRRTIDVDRPGAPRPGEDGVQSWDPCLFIGRLDASGTAWFYLPTTACGLDEASAWTPLREQSQEEFAEWVLDQLPAKEQKAARKELRALAKEEIKRQKEE